MSLIVLVQFGSFFYCGLVTAVWGGAGDSGGGGYCSGCLLWCVMVTNVVMKLW